jgi:hypothetical protein
MLGDVFVLGKDGDIGLRRDGGRKYELPTRYLRMTRHDLGLRVISKVLIG